MYIFRILFSVYLIHSICASTFHDAEGVQVDAELKTVYAVVLPICAACKSEGAKIVFGRYLPNGRRAWIMSAGRSQQSNVGRNILISFYIHVHTYIYIIY
jgi:hypothetical protein